MKKDWEECNLEDYIKLIDYRGRTPIKTESGVRLITAKNVKLGYLQLEPQEFIATSAYDSWMSRGIPNIGDVIFTTEAPLANVAQIDTSEKLAFAQRIIVMQPHANRIDSTFLKHMLLSGTVRNKILEKGTGATVLGIKSSLLKKIRLSFPPLLEQQRIVAILDEAFATITRAKANAEQNLKNAKELFESYLQGVFENKGEGWEEKTLGDVLVKTETVDPTKKPNEEFIYLDISSVNKETKEIENATVLLGKDAPSRARKLVRTNDVIFATVRPTHSRVALITEEYDEQVCSTGYFVLRAKEFLSNDLVYYFLLTYSFNRQMEKLQKGASYPAVTDSEVKGIYISFPKSLKEQNKIVQKLDALSTETKKLETIYQQKINDLEELKKSILQKAYSGELL